MITLIGVRCTHSNVFSRDVLIARFLLGKLESINHACSTLLNALFWWLNAKVTPLPIPNREVKLCSGDDTPCGESS